MYTRFKAFLATLFLGSMLVQGCGSSEYKIIASLGASDKPSYSQPLSTTLDDSLERNRAISKDSFPKASVKAIMGQFTSGQQPHVSTYLFSRKQAH